MTKYFGAMLFLAGLLTGCAESTADIPAVSELDIARFSGKWYEIARLPHYFERGMNQVTAEYTPLPDGIIRVENRGIRDGEAESVTGKARRADKSGGGNLEVSFFWIFYSGYRVVYLEPDYRAMLVAGNRKNYFWILARTPEIPREDLNRYLKMASGWGFATEKLEYPAPAR